MFDKIIFISICLISINQVRSIKVCNESLNNYWKLGMSKNCYDSDLDVLNTTMIIKKMGYKAEEYTVTTPDGYILTINRGYQKETDPPLLVLPSIASNSLQFVDRLNKSIVYELIQNHYDVYILNYRGTIYSRKHVNLTTSNDDYWKFTFNELGIYDVRTAVNFIYQKRSKKILVLAYSAGTTASYVYGSIYSADAKNQLKGMVHLAPVAYINNMKSILKYMAPFVHVIEPFVYMVTHGELLIVAKIIRQLLFYPTPIQMYLFQFMKGFFFGFDLTQMEPESMPIIIERNLDTVSITVLVHYAQLISNQRFQEYDYGITRNEKIYGSSYPPLYDVSEIKVPIKMFVGENDYISSVVDTKYLYSLLSKSTQAGYEIVNYTRMTHDDFVVANGTDLFLYPLVLKSLDAINKA